jgi:hypothetical protein
MMGRAQLMNERTSLFRADPLRYAAAHLAGDLAGLLDLLRGAHPAAPSAAGPQCMPL